MEPKFCTEMQYKFLKVIRNAQSSFRIKFNKKVIYIDPVKIEEENHDADYIFITHEHHDHFDIESLRKIIKDTTQIITNQKVADELKEQEYINPDKIIILPPEDHLDVDNEISIDTKPAYNLDKFKDEATLYHPKENKGLGFIINFEANNEKVKLFHMGDTDFLPEYHKVEGLDILLIPIGGKYVMTLQEAIAANNEIKPQISIPMHFGMLDEKRDDAIPFINSINNEGVVL